MAHHVCAAFREHGHLPDRQALAELEQAGFGQQGTGFRLPKEIEVQARSDGERHWTDLGKDCGIKREVREAHH